MNFTMLRLFYGLLAPPWVWWGRHMLISISRAVPSLPQLMLVAGPVKGRYHLLEELPLVPRQSVFDAMPQESS